MGGWEGGESVGEKLGGRVGGENKRGGGEELEGWSRVVKFLNSPERPEQGELSSFIHLLLHPPQYEP